MTVGPDFIRGSKGLSETTAFSKEFPINPDPEMWTLLTVSGFDDWAAKQGYYSLDCDQETINQARNRLRKKINHTACSEAWVGNTPFHIAVRVHGESYVVQPAEDAFSEKANRLPSQVNSLVKTKHMALKLLRSSVDMDHLPVGLRLRVEMLERSIERCVRDVSHTMGEYNREFTAVQQMIAELVKQHLIENGIGVRAIIDAGDGEEGT